ncbi:MAG: hypothetical protein FD123_15 [Bacteroidetes bacterium]|nr:MAG: hypothetical protein FD123_15 [Bacteroidota bacterium]
MMSYRSLFTLLVLFLASFGVKSQVILVEGNYQGKNLYVQNPFASNGIGFCVYEVRVNDQVSIDEIASSAFEIDLRNYKLNPGDKVEVKIFHKGDCKPKVLNPEVLKPKSTFEVTTMDVKKEGNDYILKWQTRNESGKLTYIVEQFRWNKWVKVGEVDGTGLGGPNDYSFKVVPHSGQNQFRVKQVDYTGQPRVSRAAPYTSPTPEIKFEPVKADKEITFIGGETMYEIYDQFGNIVKKGFGGKIDLNGLARGGYFLNYDNKTGEFFKR